MSCANNVSNGKSLVLLIRNDGDTEWEIAGGIKERSLNFGNPTEETTSSSTIVSFTESQFTGYSSASINISGVADKRTGIVDPVTGLNIVGYSRIFALATSGNRCGKFKFLNVDTNGSLEGFFTITSFNITGSTPGLVNFDAALESKADVTVTGTI